MVGKREPHNQQTGGGPTPERHGIGRDKLEEDLCRAVALRRFELLYQPIVDPASGRITRVEALLRWNDPGRGPVPPSVFIPILESHGLIAEVGDWVVREAASACRSWRDTGGAAIRIHVNVSPRQLCGAGFAESFLNAVAGWSDESCGLDIEITEGVLEETQATPVLSLLRRHGVGISIDDFGTAYSSLARICSVPVDQFKIDRSFVERLPDDGRSAAVVTTIVELAARFHATTIAEGVENPSQLAFLRRLGCDYSQGYLHYPALDKDALGRTLRQHYPPMRHAIDSSRRARQTIELEHLVDSFFDWIGYIPADAERVRSPAALPPRLRTIALAAKNAGWRAWRVDGRIRFVRIELCSSPSSPRCAIRATFYDVDGRCGSATLWEQCGNRRWRLRHVVPHDECVPQANETTLLDVLSETARVALGNASRARASDRPGETLKGVLSSRSAVDETRTDDTSTFDTTYVLDETTVTRATTLEELAEHAAQQRTPRRYEI